MLLQALRKPVKVTAELAWQLPDVVVQPNGMAAIAIPMIAQDFTAVLKRQQRFPANVPLWEENVKMSINILAAKDGKQDFVPGQVI
jgi:hypothetical protein